MKDNDGLVLSVNRNHLNPGFDEFANEWDAGHERMDNLCFYSEQPGKW